MQDNVYKQVTGLVAILLIAVLLAPAAFAAAAEAPRANGSAAKVSAALQKLKTQLAVIRQQVKTLEGQNDGPRTPTGAAGGDLTGPYPNPLIGPNTVAAADLAVASVGSSELAPLVAHVTAGRAVTAAGGAQNVEITCPGNRTLVAGGYAWQDDEGNSIIASAPSETDPTHTWVVRRMVDAGSNTLFGWATCLTG